jgi:hypothetical protein
MRMSAAVLIAVCVSMAGSIAVADQLGSATRTQTIDTRVLLAMVTDTGNRPLVELEPDDFVVDENGEQRNILSLHMADYPIVVLLDDTASSPEDQDAIRAAAGRFVSRVGERPFAVGMLTAPTLLISSLADNRATVLDRLRRFAFTGAGTPLVLQAAAHAAQLIRDTGSPFAAIVILSERPVTAAEASDREFLTAIVSTGAPVYVVAQRSAEAPASGADGSDDVLRAIAEQTRGQYTAIYSSASFSIALDRLADRLSTEMMLEYVEPPGAVAGDVRVGVKIPGARATGLGVSK